MGKDILEAESGKAVAHIGMSHEVQRSSEPGCSKKWRMCSFGEKYCGEESTVLRSDVPQQANLSRERKTKKTCSECQNTPGELKGTFSCATDKCIFAPSSLFCTAMGGEWCSPEPPSKRICEDSHDWGALPSNESRVDCASGCSYAVCEKKIH